MIVIHKIASKKVLPTKNHSNPKKGREDSSEMADAAISVEINYRYKTSGEVQVD